MREASVDGQSVPEDSGEAAPLDAAQRGEGLRLRMVKGGREAAPPLWGEGRCGRTWRALHAWEVRELADARLLGD